MPELRFAVTLAVALVAAGACGSLVGASPTPTAPSVTASASPRPSPSPTSSPAVRGRDLPAAEAQRLVGARVRTTLDALKRRDGAALAAVAHPSKGVRFTAYPFVNVSRDVVLSRAELATAYTDARTRTWGVTDGRGDPITLTFADYDKRYVYSRDFAAATRTAYNQTIGRGNSTDNTADVYPNAILFEAYDPGPDPALADVRWQCLRLLYEADGSEWFLVGVVHGEWTI